MTDTWPQQAKELEERCIAEVEENKSLRAQVAALREHLLRMVRFAEDAPRCDFNEDKTLSWLQIATHQARQALASAPVPTLWRPISEAPRDRKFDAWSNGGRIIGCEWYRGAIVRKHSCPEVTTVIYRSRPTSCFHQPRQSKHREMLR